jgi:hypothetical protein
VVVVQSRSADVSLVRKTFTLLFISLILLPAAFAEADWGGLQVGQEQPAAAARMGPPLLSTRGHGYEVWFYDHQGEVTLYRGKVLYWSLPREVAVAAPPAIPAPKPVVPSRPATAVVEKAPVQSDTVAGH